MTEEAKKTVVLDEEARRFLKTTGVVVVSIEVAVVLAVWLFQAWFGR
jgi:hypothetical protein